MTSQTTETFANPDGSFTDEIAVEPVRVNRAGAWLPVDSTLQANLDGSWSPKVSATSMRFSGGGTQPLAVVTRGGVTVDLTWPESLPVPVIEGDTAIYQEVYPGVDLEVTAAGTSLTHRIVVKSRAAASDPRVRTVHYGQTVRGGQKVSLPGGGMKVTDGFGQTVFESPEPIMWDSSSSPTPTSTGTGTSSSKQVTATKLSAAGADTGGASEDASGGTSDAPVEGDRVSELSSSITADTLTVAPPAAVLDSASTSYPVIIDPPLGTKVPTYTMVDAAYPTVSYYKYPSADQGVGYQDFSAWSRKRLFYGFTTSGYNGTLVKSATFSAYEVYSATCSAGTVDAYLTNMISSATTWNNQPSRIGSIRSSFSVKAGRSDCNSGGYWGSWDVKSAVVDRTTAKASTTTIQLAGRSETTDSSWMRFAGPSTANYPRLSVVYTHIPSQVSTGDMKAPTSTTSCSTSSTNPVTIKTDIANNAYFYAKVKDGDTGTMYLDVLIASQTLSTAGFSVTANTLSAQQKIAIPTTLTNNGVYSWKARARDDDGGVGAWSAYCWFKVDNTKPSPPEVVVTGGNEQLLPAGTTSVGLTFTQTDAKYFDWKLGTSTQARKTATSGSAPATASLNADVTSVTAQAIDAANNVSNSSPPVWLVRATPQRLAGFGFNSMTDPGAVTGSPYGAQADQWHLPISPDQTPWTDGRYAGCVSGTDASGNPLPPCSTPADLAVSFPDGSSPVSDDHRPVRTDASFTVGTWVHVDEDAGVQTILAQDGTDGYRLEYVPDFQDASMTTPAPRFVFSVGSGASTVKVADALPATEARTSRWVYVAGIYNKLSASSSEITVTAVTKYGVDDNGQGPIDQEVTSAPVALSRALTYATGTFRLGDSAVSTPLRGSVDNLSFYQAAMAQLSLSDAASENYPGAGA
ncbi:hypothetical protein ASH01_19935 [Terrabacter sp. Soil811]|uniref:CBM96 family carbohydrate-binding protein n=1 Tax=Terrabacter sp. Soil811 TaxID=1736419 RepID=UPI0006F608A6|nr:LamG-like jellyroll fold domain-containing protein [Terrabacter sp. Soil811]KRF39618.1 hypothetical protein ASH01_19935 [Terrabacter sp. Soil811]